METESLPRDCEPSSSRQQPSDSPSRSGATATFGKRRGAFTEASTCSDLARLKISDSVPAPRRVKLGNSSSRCCTAVVGSSGVNPVTDGGWFVLPPMDVSARLAGGSRSGTGSGGARWGERPELTVHAAVLTLHEHGHLNSRVATCPSNRGNSTLLFPAVHCRSRQSVNASVASDATRQEPQFPSTVVVGIIVTEPQQCTAFILPPSQGTLLNSGRALPRMSLTSLPSQRHRDRSNSPCLPHTAFPNPMNRPPHCTKLAPDPKVAPAILLDLLAPEPGIVSRSHVTPRAAVPKAAVDEDGHVLAGPCEVRAAGQGEVASPPGQSFAAQQCGKGHLGRSVASTLHGSKHRRALRIRRCWTGSR